MKLLRILSLPLYHTRLSFAMIKISHESIVKLKLDRRESYCWEILPQKEQRYSIILKISKPSQSVNCYNYKIKITTLLWNCQ